MNPKLLTYLNIAAAVTGAVALMSPSLFPSYIPPGVVKDILETAGFVTAIGGAVNAALHAATSTQTAMIQSVNSTDNGVKVVAATSPSPAVNEPQPPVK